MDLYDFSYQIYEPFFPITQEAIIDFLQILQVKEKQVYDDVFCILYNQEYMFNKNKRRMKQYGIYQYKNCSYLLWLMILDLLVKHKYVVMIEHNNSLDIMIGAWNQLQIVQKKSMHVNARMFDCNRGLNCFLYDLNRRWYYRYQKQMIGLYVNQQWIGFAVVKTDISINGLKKND